MDLNMDFLDSYFVDTLDECVGLGDSNIEPGSISKIADSADKCEAFGIENSKRKRILSTSSMMFTPPSKDVNYGPIVMDSNSVMMSNSEEEGAGCFMNMTLNMDPDYNTIATSSSSAIVSYQSSPFFSSSASTSSSTVSVPSPCPISPSIDYNFNVNDCDDIVGSITPVVIDTSVPHLSGVEVIPTSLFSISADSSIMSLSAEVNNYWSSAGVDTKMVASQAQTKTSNKNVFKKPMEKVSDVFDIHFDSQLSPSPAASYNENLHQPAPYILSPVTFSAPAVSSSTSSHHQSSIVNNNGIDKITLSPPEVNSVGEEESWKFDWSEENYHNPASNGCSSSFSIPEQISSTPIHIHTSNGDTTVKNEAKTDNITNAVDVVFKTDLSRFFSRRIKTSNASQSGQNSIPLSQERKPEERLWYVEDGDMRYVNNPVLRRCKRGRGRPKGRSYKIRQKEMLTKLSRRNGVICARCVELYQVLRLKANSPRPDISTVICEECGTVVNTLFPNICNKSGYSSNKEDLKFRVVEVENVTLNENRVTTVPQFNVGVTNAHNVQRSSSILPYPSDNSGETIARYPGPGTMTAVTPGVSNIVNLAIGTEIEIDGTKVINIRRPTKRRYDDMRCWKCSATTSSGPWHRHKTVHSKFLCHACLNYFNKRNEDSNAQLIHVNTNKM